MERAKGSSRGGVRCWALSLGLCSLAPFAAAAAPPALPYDALVQRLSDLDTRVRELEQGFATRPQELPEAEQASRRLTDAQVLYTLRNYEAAATILFDVVDRYPKAPAYADALFYLGDSLYQKRDYLAARRFFERLVDGFAQHPRYQEALQRLVEVSIHLGVYDQIDKWLDRLTQIPKEKQLASVPYVRGKYHFIRQEHDKAQKVLSEILPESPYAFQARYFIGASFIQKEQLQEAAGAFGALAKMPPRTDEEKRVVELAHLALGRIFYEQGQTTRSHEEYLAISQKSDLFQDALFESAWVAIKGKEYKRALRQLELLVLAQPDALSIPEAKMLMGNLQIRLGEHQPATKWFVKTRDEFLPVQKQLEEVLQQNADPQAYFRDLIRKHLSRFDIAVMVPKVAAKWMVADPGVLRFATLAGDVSELERSLKEAEDTVQRVEKALSGSQRFNVDRQLASIREESVQAAGELLGMRRHLSETMLGAVAQAASVEEMRQLGEFGRRRGDLEKDYARTIATLGSRNRAEALRAQVNELDKRASELSVHLETLRKQRQAIEKYYADTKKQQKISQEQFAKELAEVAGQEQEQTRLYEALRKDLEEAMNLAGQEDTQLQAGSQVQRDYAEAVQKEQELFNSLRLRLNGAARVRGDQVWHAFDRAFKVDQRLTALTTKVNQLLDQKLGEAQASLLLEKENIRTYRQALSGCTTDTEDVGGGVLADALRSTAKRFYDIVVRSDIGIIDVAWAVKQQRTERISRLVREQKRELKLLDDEYKEVLKE